MRSRAAVIAATLDLVRENGIAATTIEAVAERSGVAKTTIYRQWDAQPALVLDAIASTLREPADPDTGTLRQDLVVLLAGLAAALHRSPAAALMPALIEAAERDPAFAALHRHEATHRHRVVRDVITRGIDRRELPQDTDPDEVLDLLTGPVFYRRWVSTGAVDQHFTTRIVDVVLAGYESRRRTRN
ncbi:TetR/AcrR family transcriptional regulator [Cellulomonas fimi]|uniref:TetR/AcrR family transcriptional regulator n=1 Tax=Cellulomonas fimi TaxID=1708 RepID=UPI0028933718|nr:TetR/AcrR family transcriptional regulator [Cellulomonas fimi]